MASDTFTAQAMALLLMEHPDELKKLQATASSSR
jgi:hypothetical protein